MKEWLTMDPYIVLSLVNMKLRNFYPSLNALCEDLSINRKVLEDKLSVIGYHYEASGNHFTAFMEKKGQE